MIGRHSGALTLHDTEVHPHTSEAQARAAGWAPAGAVLLKETRDHRDRPVFVTLRYIAGRLAGIELRYAIRRPAEDVHGKEDWELARKDYHDAIVREWFASTVHDLLYAPPPQPGPLTFHFPWGDVRSDRHGADESAIIKVRYTGEAH